MKRTKTKQTKAFAYMRVSDISQVNGDGFKRQTEAIREYALRNQIQIVKFYQEDISGTEYDRPQFAEMMLSLEQNGHGIKTVLIEKLDRLARDLMVQEVFVRDFQAKGISLISALEGDALCSNDPTRTLVRQLFGSIAEYDKRMLVLKLKAARDRVRAKTGRCEGRKMLSSSAEGKHLIELIKELRKRPTEGKRLTLQQIADQLNDRNITTPEGRRWSLRMVQWVIQSN